MDTPIRNIVFSCPEGTWSNDRWEGPPRTLASFYAELLGMQIVREDWLVIAKDQDSSPRLAFDEGPSDYRPPRWPDPEYPQQLHLDITVDDLPAAEALVLGLGASLLQDKGAYRSYADPVGHPFCLYRNASAAEGQTGGPAPGRLARVVFDCFSPRTLAGFYGDLLGMRNREQDMPERVVIAGDGAGPMLAFQHAPALKAPRWPDPLYPQQIHLDLDVEDGKAAQELAERLGAIRLPEMGGSCPVFADPAAHPFCLCGLDQ
jgi:hypothetical protein